MLAAGVGIDVERAPRRRREIQVQRSGNAVRDHVDGSRHGVRGHGNAAGHGFEIDQAEGIGTARKHHDVGRREVLRQILAETVAHESGMRVLLLEPRPLRTVADDDLAAGPGHLQECIDVLFDRYAAYVGGDRARQREEFLRMRPEHLGIDAPAPGCQVLEAMRREILAHRGGAHHATYGRAVEPAQRAVGRPERDREARPQILGKLGVIGGREAYSGPQAKTSGAQAQGSFGRYMHSLRRKCRNMLFHPLVGEERQADFRVGRARDAAKIPGGDHADFMTEAAQPRRGLRQSADHTVRLGKPRVGNDHDSHAGPESHRGMTER